MIVTCTLCGSTFHGNVEPYCFDADKDPEWAKSLKKYEKQKWISISIANHGEYKITSANKCCTSGKEYDVPAKNKLRPYGGEDLEIKIDDNQNLKQQQPKVTPQTLF